MAMLQNHRKAKGFTLIEAVLSLFITCLLIVTIDLKITDSQLNYQERLSLKKFEENWNNMLNFAYLNHKEVQVVKKGQHQIFFMTFLHPDKVITLPEDMTVNFGRSNVHAIHMNGYTQPDTIRFYSRKYDCWYIYKINLDWGMLDGPHSK